MAEAAKISNGSMAAILGLDDDVVEQLCEDVDGVWPANYNCPGQIVVSGEESAVEKLIHKATALGARRAVTFSFRLSGPAPASLTVELVSTAKGFRRSQTTDSSGSFTFAALQPGPYTLRASLSGFTTIEKTNVPQARAW